MGGHYIVIKLGIQDDFSICNICAQKLKSTLIHKKLLHFQSHIDPHILIMWLFSIFLTNKHGKPKNTKQKILELTDIIN